MDKSTKARTIIGIIVLIFANTAAGGAEWCSSDSFWEDAADDGETEKE